VTAEPSVVFITGGTRGIGAGAASAFVRTGAIAFLAARDREHGTASARDLTDRGPGQARFVECDVTDTDRLRASIDAANEEFGRLDCLVNNAVRFAKSSRLDDVEMNDLRLAFETNIFAYFAAARFALPHLRRTRGSIVNVGSLVSEIGMWHNPVYAATKGAITSFTRALAVDEAENGVRVNAVLPGNVVTHARVRAEEQAHDRRALNEFLESQQWLGRSGTSEEVGEVIQFLASDSASFITGAAIVVSGGAELAYGMKRPYPDFGI
jgi:NAD(P)-dependent dehydrogenase (short-subunit alcohol dehydrogenase family)